MSGPTGISQRNPLLSVFFILCTVVIGFVIIGPIIGFFFSLPFYEGTMIELVEKIQSPMQYPELRIPVLIMQGFATLIGLILVPYIYLYAFEQISAKEWLAKNTHGVMALVVTLATIAFMGTNSVFIEWNANFVFPDFMKGFGEWAREREDLAAELTKFFTTFETTGDFILGLFVIALLPAIGEELVFRGMLQPEFYRASGNHHAAIWITAFIFSAFHMQFFGFVPRLLLGAFFGYLYVWSGNLWMPMVAHFINNGFSVLMIYLYQKGTIPIDMESTEAAPWPVVASFTLVFAGLLFYFHTFYKKQNTAAE
jgi:uncharacterized protein